MKTVVEMARESKVVPVLLVPHGEYFKFLEHFAELVRADERNSWPAEMEAMERQVNILTDALAQEREAFVAKIQSEIDHAHLNELRLTPSFGKRQGEIAVRASSLDAALDAIRARSNT